MKSQKRRISEYMAKTGKWITPLEAQKMFECMRLSERIREIEMEGDKIQRLMIYKVGTKTKNPTRYMSYRMV